MASLGSGDLGYVEDELSFLQDYQELVEFHGPRARHMCNLYNAATSDYYDIKTAVGTRNHCCLCLITSQILENIAFYLENLGVCYTNSDEHDS